MHLFWHAACSLVLRHLFVITVNLNSKVVVKQSNSRCDLLSMLVTFSIFCVFCCSKCSRNPVDDITKRVTEMGNTFCEKFAQVT